MMPPLWMSVSRSSPRMNGCQMMNRPKCASISALAQKSSAPRNAAKCSTTSISRNRPRQNRAIRYCES